MGCVFLFTVFLNNLRGPTTSKETVRILFVVDNSMYVCPGEHANCFPRVVINFKPLQAQNCLGLCWWRCWLLLCQECHCSHSNPPAPVLVFPFPLIRQDNTQLQNQLTVPRCGTVCISSCLGTYPLLEAGATSVPCPPLLRALHLLAGKVSSPPSAPGWQEERQDSAKLLHTHALEKAVSTAHEVYSSISSVWNISVSCQDSMQQLLLYSEPSDSSSYAP